MPAGAKADSLKDCAPGLTRGMIAAIRAARRGEGCTSPNPLVGAALEVPAWRRSKGSARGAGSGAGAPAIRAAGHLHFGGPHAEARLLSGVGMLSRGAVLYLTLEPCCHQGKTGPCVERILAARPSRVVIATLDPNPAVAGGGVRLLRKAGIRVEVGMGEREALSLTLPFHTFHTLGRALVRLKIAATLDARLSDQSGMSRWITGEEARRDVHRERSRADAVMVGSATALADDPELTVRDLCGPQPSRIVLDSQLRIPPDNRVWRAWREEIELARGGRRAVSDPGGLETVSGPGGSRTASADWRRGNYRMVETPSGSRWTRETRLILATRTGHSAARLERFRSLGWEVWTLPAGRRGPDGCVSLKALTARAGREGLLAILAEAGPSLAAALLASDLADEMLLYQAPTVLGGPSSWPGSGYVADLGSGRSYVRLGEKRLGQDLLVRLRRRGLLERVRKRVHGLG